MVLQVLVVEDEQEQLNQFEKDFAKVFTELQIDARIHPCNDFDEANSLVTDQCRRFDLVISDTYRGNSQNGDAKVIDMVINYRGQGKRFCPIVVYSSSSRPDGLVTSDFVRWADKAEPNGIENAIKAVLSTGIPQVARKLHDELDQAAGSFLWGFLEENWAQLTANGDLQPNVLERLIRRRASTQIGDVQPKDGKWVPVSERTASEYYLYPRLDLEYFGLGDILVHRENEHDIRVILTPHCHLFLHSGKEKPSADYVLTVKTEGAHKVLGTKLTNASENPDKAAQHKKLGHWSRSPAATGTQPDGRHWYLPEFLDIPHLYCDFLQVESIKYTKLPEYKAIASLVPPYAEAMQSCFASFYASVGIPGVKTESIESLLKLKDSDG